MPARGALLTFLLLWPAPTLGARTATGNGHVIEVHMVDKGGGKWAFEPSSIKAQPGDTVRFVQDDIVPHNVQFKSAPPGAELGSAMMGTFLLAKGETYDLVIDGRFVVGTYAFVCTPHETMGMKGSLEVATGGGDGIRQEPVPTLPPGGIR